MGKAPKGTAWRSVWKDKLRNKFRLDKNGYIQYPSDIDEILDIIEDAIRQEKL